MMRAESKRILYVVRRALPYHRARLKALRAVCGWRVLGIESVGRDPDYDMVAPLGADTGFETAAPEGMLGAGELRELWRGLYDQHRPDVILGPAPAKAECMAAIDYRRSRPEVSVIIQDDIWSGSNRLSPLNRWVRRKIAEQLDSVLVPSGLHAWEYTGLGFPPERVFQGVNAIDVDFWSGGPRREFAERDGFLFVGRLVDKKGVGLLLDAFRRLREQHPDARLQVVGDGVARPAVTRRAEGVSGVTDVGPLAGKELRERLAASRFLVVPSLRDQWGIVVAEAMAVGTPPIVSSTTGAAWGLVRNGVSGFVFQANRSPALTNILARARELGEDEWSAMSRRARGSVGTQDVGFFTASVRAATQLGRRPTRPSGAARLVSRLWSGHGLASR